MDITKAFFRYLRGELLNGFYIRKLNLVANNLPSLSTLKTELLYWMNVQFDTQDEDYPIRKTDLKGIVQVAGILSIRGVSGRLLGWFRLSESYLVAEKQRSERGLLRQSSGELEYVRTEQDEYPTDISTLATSTLPDALRQALIPDGTVPIGFIWGDAAEVMLENGMLDEQYLHETPPEGYLFDEGTGEWYWPLDYQTDPPPIYAPWYGNQFLALANSYPLTTTLSDDLLMFLFLAQQRIKYNGLGLLYLFEATTEMIPDLITDLKLELLDANAGTEYHTWYYKMTFTRVEENFNVDDGWGRFSAWNYFIQSKYPFIQFNETGE